MIVATFVVLAVAGALFLYRLLRGPTLADRVNALNGLLVAGSGAIAAHAVDSGQGAFLPILVVIALVSFVGTAMVARFIESRSPSR
ncbi:MAG: monovalent cation/H+ antiporter complex subunit F [Ilumatobacteraceae bacterium]|nr:MAG: cation:proton antiporter [Actinomycetota bacterium]